MIFKGWVARLRNLGYVVEWRHLVAADYGVPTIRKRLFLIARCDGEPIVWPQRTHRPRKRAVEMGILAQTWRSAADCIDWALPCPSIFERSRPLAEATLRRIAAGLRRYVLEASEPFIVVCNHAGQEFRGQAATEPMRTVTGARDAVGVVTPYVTKFRQNSIGSDPLDPLHTITSGDGSVRPAGAAHAMGVVMPHLIGIDNKSSGAVRVSLGIASNYADVAAFLDFARSLLQ
jgi:DNA (cytosine-5)-methyltransferase 1